ncbi:hypothetical protein niasHS_003338 [Heterodera schachtii]|uniref:WRKY domain-containing protein n=1 Tax=Heterodera schachtii TaxID=97005 RepID=A0ABD2KGN9_HETSC
MDFNFGLLSLENWLIKEATLVEKAALELAVIKEQRQKVIGTATDRTECASADNGTGVCRRKTKTAELKEGENFTTRCGISWKFLTKTPKGEFEKLRRTHQVSKNRGVGYGVRYACTRNAKARDNCPFLMLSRENEEGSLSVYYRNAHTHTVRQIRGREKRAVGTASSSSSSARPPCSSCCSSASSPSHSLSSSSSFLSSSFSSSSPSSSFSSPSSSFSSPSSSFSSSSSSSFPLSFSSSSFSSSSFPLSSSFSSSSSFPLSFPFSSLSA